MRVSLNFFAKDPSGHKVGFTPEGDLVGVGSDGVMAADGFERGRVFEGGPWKKPWEFALDPASMTWAAAGPDGLIVNGQPVSLFLNRASDDARPDVDVAGENWIAGGSGGVAVNGEFILEPSRDTGQKVRINGYRDSTPVRVDMSACGQHWIAAGGEGVLKDGQWLTDSEGHKILLKVGVSPEGDSLAVALSDDGKHWIAAGRAGIIKDGVWLTDEQGKRLKVVERSSRPQPLEVALSADGSHWMVVGADAVIVDGKSYPGVKGWGDTMGVAADISPDGRHWIAAGSNGILRNGKWETDREGRRRVLHQNTREQTPVAVTLSDDGLQWAAAGASGILVNGTWLTESGLGRRDIERLGELEDNDIELEMDDDYLQVGDHLLPRSV